MPYQACWRGHVARVAHGLSARVLAIGLRRFEALVAARRTDRERRAAVMIQRRWRAFMTRREYLGNIAAISRMQAMVRWGRVYLGNLT